MSEIRFWTYMKFKTILQKSKSCPEMKKLCFCHIILYLLPMRTEHNVHLDNLVTSQLQQHTLTA